MPQRRRTSLVDNVSKELEAAGAQVTTKVSLDGELFSPEQRPMVDPLVNQLVTADVTFDQDSTTYQRAGQILARGHRREGGGPVGRRRRDQDHQRADRVEADVGVKPTPKDRATLVVVVAGKPPTPAPDDNTLRRCGRPDRGAGHTAAAVWSLAGTPETAQNGGMLKAMRADSDATKIVSSVDVADLPSGRATVVFALVEQAEGKAGQYGGVDAKDGVAPAAVLAAER